MKKSKKHIFVYALGMTLLTACTQDTFLDGGETKYSGEPMLEFRTSFPTNQSTRALTQTPEIVTPVEFDGYFYNEINDPKYYNPDKPDSPLNGQNLSKFGEYKVPESGNGGILQFKGDDARKPNWYTIDDDHFFWSWTLPWLEGKAEKDIDFLTWGDADENGMVRTRTRGEDDNDANDGEEDGDGEQETPSFTPGSVDPVAFLNTNPFKIKLKDTRVDEFTYRIENIEDDEGNVIKVEKDSSWNVKSWGNGYYLEKFVGAKSGPYDFRRNGVEVPLQFRHLMSKISIRSLLFYRANGTTEEDLQAHITFINMPTEFTFYPHPSVEDYERERLNNPYIQVDGPPIVVTNQESADPNGGIMFAFTNPIDLLPDLHPDEKVQYRDKFYICPEVDFSKVSFRVDMLDERLMTKGEYYGDFQSVAFERDPGTDYDNKDILDSEGKPVDDSKVLHAGETMYFDLIVREYGGGGYSIYVRNWSTRPKQKAGHYTHPGIYVDGQATDIIGTSMENKDKFETYGDGFWDGEPYGDGPSLPDHLGVYHLYTDLDMGNRTTFPLDPEYVLNGMGYNLKFSPSNTETTKVTIGKMVDIYIEINGYTIYIDPKGNICTLNKDTGKYEPNGQSIDLTDSKGSFTLDVATGTLS